MTDFVPSKKREREDNDTSSKKVPVYGALSTIVAWALVSAEDYDDVMTRRLCMMETYAALSNGQRLHHYIVVDRMGLTIPKGHVIDHIHVNNLDNRLDCRRENLRVITVRQNTHNKKPKTGKRATLDGSSADGLRGVAYHKGKWRAQLFIDRKSYPLGCYDTPEDAGKAVDVFIIHNRERLNLVHRLNYPDFDYSSMKPYAKHIRKSSFEGVSEYKNGTFGTNISFNGKPKHLGTFKTAREAAEARDDFIVLHRMNKKLQFKERHVDYDARPVKIRCELLNDGKTARLLSDNAHVNHSNVLIDMVDYDSIKHYGLTIAKDHKGCTRPYLWINKKLELLYRVLLKVIDPSVIVSHHPNPDPCDCRRQNIHLSTASINAQFKDRRQGNKYHGVNANHGSFKAKIKQNNAVVFLMYGPDDELLARARDLFLMQHTTWIYPRNFDDWDDNLIASWTAKLRNE